MGNQAKSDLRRRTVKVVQCSKCEKEQPVLFVRDGVCMYCAQAEDEAAAQAQREANRLRDDISDESQREKQLGDIAKRQVEQLKLRREEAEIRRREIAVIKAIEEEKKERFDAQAEARKELARREVARRFFLPFVERFNPEYMAGWVHKDICRRLEKFSDDIAAKKSPRLMLFMPPRHGKSELASKTFPAWHLGRHPSHEFIACSYSGALSMDFSRKVRELLRDPSYHQVFAKTQLDKDSQSAERWNTTDGGGYVAAGVGGAITGRGAHCLVIDDPVKNREDAESEQGRQNIYDWYTSTAYTRLAPGGGVLVILTRWHDDDLAGRILAQTAEGGEEWEVIRYPALATEDELYRKKGEALHPDRYDVPALERIQRNVGPRDWSALYQQNPVAEDGDYFNKPMIKMYKPSDLPPLGELRFYTAWDLAIGQKQTNDYSVGITVGVDHKQNIWIVDVQRGRWNSKELVDKVLDTWNVWRSEVTGIEKGMIEMAIGPYLEDEVKRRGYTAFYTEPLKTGRADKVLRARPLQGLMQQGRVLFRSGDDATQELINELLRFPNGTHDDCVDSLAWVAQMLSLLLSVRPRKPGTKKSWKDKLAKFTAKGKGSKSHMTA